MMIAIVKILLFVIGFIMSLFMSSCEKIDSQRIPAVAVNIELNNDGLWNTYGVHGYGQFNMFIKNQRIPANYPYTSLTFTGFGGILLISGYNAVSGEYNYPLAYDLACPVEAKNNVLVTIDRNNFEAHCKTCGSRYNVCELQGAPISGKALDYHYGMQRYSSYSSILGGYVIGR